MLMEIFNGSFSTEPINNYYFGYGDMSYDRYDDFEGEIPGTNVRTRYQRDDIPPAKVVADDDMLNWITIARVEVFLEGADRPDKYKFSEKVRERVVREYKLNRAKNNRYSGDRDRIYGLLCKRYARARLYTSLGDLVYGMMDGRREWDLPWKKVAVG